MMKQKLILKVSNEAVISARCRLIVTHHRRGIGNSAIARSKFLAFWLTSRRPFNHHVWHIACSSDLAREKASMAVVMKMSIFAALLLLGTELMARASVQGVEQAMVSTVIEWAMSRVKAAGMRRHR